MGIDQDGHEVAIPLPEKRQSLKCCSLPLQTLLALAIWFLVYFPTRLRHGSCMISWGSQKKVISGGCRVLCS